MLEHLVFKVASEKILKKKKYWYMKKMFVKKVFFLSLLLQFLVSYLTNRFYCFFYGRQRCLCFLFIFHSEYNKKCFF